MHRPSLPLVSVTLACALVLGCDDRAGVTEPASGIAPSAKAEITRFEQPLFINFGNGEFTFFSGVSSEDLLAVCAGADVTEFAEVLLITHPSKQGGTSEHRLLKAEMSANIWEGDLGPERDICELGPPLAVGTVNILINDNEGNFFETAPGANPLVLRFTGTLTNPETGQRYHVQGALQIVALQDGTFKFLPVTLLRVTPVGG
jgi:hypothetical protein